MKHTSVNSTDSPKPLTETVSGVKESQVSHVLLYCINSYLVSGLGRVLGDPVKLTGVSQVRAFKRLLGYGEPRNARAQPHQNRTE